MLAFAVYRDNAPLAQWPSEISTQAYCLFLADAQGRPRERAYDVDYGRLACYCPAGVYRQLVMRYPVCGFGDPILRTRVLHSGNTLYNLTVELALGRLEILDDECEKMRADGIEPSDAVLEEIDAARMLALQAADLDKDGDRPCAGARADAALAIALPAGERLALEAAQARLSKRCQVDGRRDLLFGCTWSGFSEGEKRGDYFLNAFNYATLPFYLNGMEPAPGKPEHAGVRQQAETLHAHGVVLKGHPLVWTYTQCVPEYHRGMDFATCCEVFGGRIRRDVPPFTDLIDYWDIINEAHDTPWANSFAFSSEQMVELTALAARVTREMAPQAKLVVNVCLPFGEYAAGAPGRVTTQEYVRACIEKGIDFDIIGIQFYYGGGQLQYCWDMLEISRILDDYCAFGKEIHITELGTPSAMGADPNAMITEDNVVGLWHEEWSETSQADWVEQFYTICLSKPAVTALTWWSFSDAQPVFWPYSGLLNKHNEPKEAYRRLLALREKVMGV